MAALQTALQLTPRAATNGARRRARRCLPRYLVERLLLDTSGYLHSALLANHGGTSNGHAPWDATIAIARAIVWPRPGWPVPAVEAQARYGWVGEVLDGVVDAPGRARGHAPAIGSIAC